MQWFIGVITLSAEKEVEDNRKGQYEAFERVL